MRHRFAIIPNRDMSIPVDDFNFETDGCAARVNRVLADLPNPCPFPIVVIVFGLCKELWADFHLSIHRGGLQADFVASNPYVAGIPPWLNQVTYSEDSPKKNLLNIEILQENHGTIRRSRRKRSLPGGIAYPTVTKEREG